MKIKTFFSIKVLVVSALFLSLTSVFTAQTPGMIYEPATGAGAAILDPNGDGYTSATTAGFTTDDQLQSEIPYSSLIFPGSEPTSDLNNAPDCGFTDFVDQGDRDPAQKYLSPAGNWLFRLRMGSISPNAKSYSILIDTDGLFGNTGANADPNWTVNNPGFEIELVLATKFGVYVYNVNTPNCTPVISYPGTTNYQKSIAGSMNCGDLDYFLDFYVVFADLVAQFPGLNVSTPMRYVIVDNTAAQASTICQPSSASDVGGVGQCATLSACFTEIINAQAFCSPNTSVCTYRSVCPTITLPIANGATSVSGTSTEASGTTIKVYKNGVQIGTTTVGVGGTWTLSGISPALANGNVITATATATGEYESLSDCNSYTIITCTGTPVAAPVVTSETGKNFCGTGLVGYDINVMYPNNTEFTPNPVSSAYLPVPTGGSWVWKCTGNTGGCNSGSGVDCIPEGGYMIYQQGPDGCLSYPAFVCLSIGGGYSPVTSPTPTIVASTVVSGSTSVGVTVSFNAAPSPQGGYVHLLLNGMPYAVSSYISAAGTVNISCPALPGCATLIAYFVQSTNLMIDAHDCYSAASTAVSITGGASTPPVINGPLCISSNLTSVSGTSVEANGTSVQLYVNAVATGAPVLVNNGSWTVSGLNIASGSTLTATATATCESVSALSTSVTVTSQSASTGLSITTSPVFEQGTTLSGTGTNGTQVQVYIDGYPIGSPVTVSGGVWTLSGIQSYELYPYGVLTATATSAGGCPSVPVTGATVQCIPPSGLLTVNPASAEFCAASGTVSVHISNSQTGVVYQLFLADGTTQTGSSLMGNGGTLTLTSGSLSASTTLKVKAFKLPPGACYIFETDVVPVYFGTNPTLSLAVSASPSAVCSGGSSTITIANSQVGFSYQLRNNADNSLVGTAVVGTGSNITINTGTVASTTTYNVLVTGPSPTLCSGQLTNTVSLTINGNPTANAGFDQTVCSGTAVTLSGSASGGTGPYVYTWNNSVTNNTAFTPLSTNTYTVTATDANGCSSQDVVIVTVNITPSVPTISTTAATCSAAETATVTNYVSGQTYTFTPSGPTAGAGGAISGMTVGTSYTLTAGNGSCTSASSSSFSIAAQLTTPATPTVSTTAATCSAAGTATVTNYVSGQTYTFTPSGPTAGAGGAISGMTAGTSYTLTTGNGSCTSASSSSFSIAAQLTTPATPTVSTAAATCSAAGTATVTNYVSGQTYTFTPSGPTAGSGGAISGMTAGTSYTLTAGNGSCTSASSSSFSIAAQLTTPATPTVSTTAATCSAAGTATVTNYVSGQTYTFTPSGPTAGAGGAISGMTAGTSYTLTTGNGSCTSASSSSFSIAAQLTTPATPTVSTAAATCSAAGTATVTNYVSGQTYTFTPSGPTAGAGGAISGMTAGTSYAVTAGNGSCTSVASSTFSIAAQLTTPATPTISTSAATCSAAGTATVTNYNAAQTYTFTPSGPTAGSGGVISGMTAGTSYSVTTTNTSSCTSAASTPFSIAAQLTTPATPTVSTAAATCSAAGTATVTNYVSGQTYTFTPSGPTAGAGGAISGMTAGTSYTLTTGNGSCTSASSSSFSIAAQLTTPATPTVSTAAATCSAAGTATVTNYVSGQTYTFTPSGPTAGSGGVISGMTAGTSYSVTTTNTSSCTSVASTPFSIAAQLTTPATPTISTSAATCSAAGTATVTNYVSGQTYTFTPSGPTAGAGGVISGMTAGTSYTLTTGNGSCTSASSSSFSIAAQLTTPATPTVSTTAATCSAAGTATVTNYVSGQTYTFTPSGPTAGAGGAISGMTAGTSYTVTTTNTSSCASVASSSFSIAVPLCGPTANDNTATTNEEQPVVISSIQSNDTDVDGTVVTSTIDLDPTTPGQQTTITTVEGTWVLNTITGNVTFTPVSNYNGTATITYTIQDNAGLTSNAANIVVTVNPVNDPPLVDNDANTINEDQGPATGDLTDIGDSDPDGTTLVVNTTPVDGPNNGTITINADGTYSYTPNAGFNGQDTIVVSVCDSGTPLPAQCVNETLVITVTPINDAPNAVDDVASTNEDSPVTIDVTNNDTDSDGSINDASVTIVTNPSNGIVTVNPSTGEVAYTPNPGYNGTDSFVYSVCDNGTPLPAQCDQATVTITVNPVNDPPVVDNDANTINEDEGPATGDLTDTGDSDPDGTTLVVNTTPVDGPNNGTITINADGTYSYTPNAGFNGQDTIVVSVCDSGTPLPAQCVNETLVITVTPINDAPNAVDDVASTNEDSPVTIDVTNNDTDSDGSINDASVTIVTNPSNGIVTVNPSTGEVTYTPNPGYNGTDSFVYSVCDNGTPLPAQCDQATVTITVNPVNDPPVVDNDANTINEDEGPATGDLTDTGDSDPDGTTLVVNTTPVDGPNNGTITINADGTYSYTPNAGFNGQDTIVVSVCDSGTPLPAQCVNDTLVITVTPINDAPNAVIDSSTTNENITVVISVTTNDTDSDGNINNQSVTITDNPTNGNVSVNTTTGQITYSPNSGFTGTDTLIYQICDDGTPLPAACDTAMVIINVLPCGTDLTADCDGDGVTNGDEIDPDGDGTPGPNGTDPSNPCSLNLADQTVAPSQAWLDADCDGDGVTNGDEVDPDGDGTPGPNGTNPSNPCSFNAADQDLATVSQAWLDADCDGDGVTNGDEVDPDGDGTPGPNGTNPSDPCSFNAADQDLATVSQAWLDADCDGDGVTNGDEVDPDGDGTPGPNGTNPSDPCSFNAADQDLATVSQGWLDADCDGDGVTNGDEVDPDGDGTPGPNGTNPSDPCSFNSADQDLAAVSQAWLDADCDGDGVTNGDEVDPDGDGTPGPNGTNPSDPCSFNLADQDLATVSQAWLDADCDGDGVANGDEVDPDGDGTPGPNGTNPSDPCSFNSADQDLAAVSQAWLDADCDGDGVTNGDEVDPDGDGTPGPNGTNPSDPCSFNLADQDLATVSQAWLDADCDGDGVTNGDEVDPDGDGTAGPNGTNPSDPCSFDLANQDFSSANQAWLDADCDGDGVTNGNEIDPDGDGTPGPNATDPTDPCSLNVADQTVVPSQAWLDADCDGDGLTNGEEINGGSNPLDPCDPNTNFPGCNTDISIPEAFTPDGDNTNDLFVIPGIENYPLNNLTFFNRWGNEVFFAQGYNNTWDGTPNRGIIIGDSKLPTGTYYYILDLNGDGETIYKGYVYLKR